MIGLVAETMQKAIDALSNREDLEFAFHWGEAGGIAASAGVFGVKALELCDDISDAYENADADFMNSLLQEALERPDMGKKRSARTRDSELRWLEMGTALQEAMKAKDEGDLVRHSLMTGFTVGLMFWCKRLPHVGERIYNKIIEGYLTGSEELLEQAASSLRAGVRLSDPMSFMDKDESARYYEERIWTMRWVQNFGLRRARIADDKVGMPNSLRVNFQLVQKAHHDKEVATGDEVE